MEDKTVLLKIEEVLIDEGFVSFQEKAEARACRKTHIEQSKKQLGFILLEQNKMTQEQLMRLLSLPEMLMQIGKTAVERELISQEQLEECQQQVEQGNQPLSRF